MNVKQKHSRELIIKLSQLMNDETLRAWAKTEEIDSESLIAWLSECHKKSTDKKSRFDYECLIVSLLDDLYDSYLTQAEVEKRHKETTPTRLNQLGFSALILAGSLVAICEGFDGVASILGLFEAIPTMAVFAAGIIFSLLSLSLFYGFELMEISAEAGVSLKKSRELLDVFLEQVEHINLLKKMVEARYAKENLSADEREELRRIAVMLIARNDALDEERKRYLSIFNSPTLKVARFITAGMTAILFFSSGYFTGQTLALTVAGLFLSSVAPTMAPVIAVSIVVGLAALLLYWAVHRSSLENLVGHWMGLSRENIKTFSDEDIVREQKNALQELEEHVVSVNKAHIKLSEYDSPPPNKTTHALAATAMATKNAHYGFFRRTRSLGDIEHATPAPKFG
jgi:ABC-type multidrug transport system fused ATPase/permease subunit